MEEQKFISLDLIDPNPYQPRQGEDLEAIQELAESIERNGLLQVPTARRVDGRYQLAFGHTRRAAFALLADTNGHDRSMPLIVRDLTDLQMFELAVAENIKRRDLNPIEQAEAMKRYMEEFGKTSKEAGEFFNVSEETVRGTVRLNNLVPEAKKLVRDGRMNITTARTLLSMQKIAPPQVVAKTVLEIDMKEDRDPEERIEWELDHLETVEEMWRDDREGKPRGGYELWLLDMKNFPNKQLPELEAEDTVEVFGKDADLKKITEWIEMRTAPLATTVPSLGEEINQKLEHLINPPSCTACPFYAKLNGSHYCGMRLCHTRKRSAWRRQRIEQASRKLGIAIHADEDGPYVILQSYNDKHSKPFEKRDDHLRLIGKEKLNGYHWQGFDGVDADHFVVVAVGELAEKLIETTSSRTTGGKKTEKEKAEQRAMRLYRQRRKELMWEYTAVAQSLFNNIPFSVLDKIERWKFVGIDDRIPDKYQPEKVARGIASNKENIDFKRREVVWNVIFDLSSHYHRESLVEILDECEELTGVKTPKELRKRVETWDAEIKETARVVKGKAKK